MTSTKTNWVRYKDPGTRAFFDLASTQPTVAILAWLNGKGLPAEQMLQAFMADRSEEGFTKGIRQRILEDEQWMESGLYPEEVDWLVIGSGVFQWLLTQIRIPDED